MSEEYRLFLISVALVGVGLVVLVVVVWVVVAALLMGWRRGARECRACKCRTRNRSSELCIAIEWAGEKTECASMSTTTNLKVGQSKTFGFRYKKRDGSAARVDGVPTVRSQDDAVCGIEIVPPQPLPDGQTADPNAPQVFRGKLRAKQAGPVRVYINADADLGEGVSSITHHIDVVVSANDEASEIEVEFGEPVNESQQP